MEHSPLLINYYPVRWSRPMIATSELPWMHTMPVPAYLRYLMLLHICWRNPSLSAFAPSPLFSFLFHTTEYLVLILICATLFTCCATLMLSSRIIWPFPILSLLRVSLGTHPLRAAQNSCHSLPLISLFRFKIRHAKSNSFPPRVSSSKDPPSSFANLSNKLWYKQAACARDSTSSIFASTSLTKVASGALYALSSACKSHPTFYVNQFLTRHVKNLLAPLNLVRETRLKSLPPAAIFHGKCPRGLIYLCTLSSTYNA